MVSSLHNYKGYVVTLAIYPDAATLRIFTPDGRQITLETYKGDDPTPDVIKPATEYTGDTDPTFCIIDWGRKLIDREIDHA